MSRSVLIKLTDIVLIFSSTSPSVNKRVYQWIYTVEGLRFIVIELAGDIEAIEDKIEAMHGSREQAGLLRRERAFARSIPLVRLRVFVHRDVLQSWSSFIGDKIKSQLNEQ